MTRTLADLGPTKLHEDEQRRVREAADTLLFCDDAHDEAVVAALADARAVVDHLIASGRWTEERGARLADDITACGPVVPVPDLESWVRARWEHYEPGWVSRDPAFTHAHITALAPFLPSPTAADLAAVGAIAASSPGILFVVGPMAT